VIGSREWAAGFIHLWNNKFFHARFTEAILCREEPTFGPPGYAVYLTHRNVSPDVPSGPMPSPDDHQLKSITAIRLVEDPNGRQWGTLHVIAGQHGEGSDQDLRGSSGCTSSPRPKEGQSTSRMIPSSESFYLSIPLPPSPAFDSPHPQ
jgi:hypothetical protein